MAEPAVQWLDGTIDETKEGVDELGREYTIIYWLEPPKKEATHSPNRALYKSIVEQLKTRPGEWAMVEEGWVGRSGKPPISAALRYRGCQVKTRQSKPGVVDTYARWRAGT